MSERKYSIFTHQGGLGKSIAATAVAQAIKNNFPERELIIVTPWPELWVNLPFVYRVFGLGATSYFYEEFIRDKGSLIFGNEPYFTSTHVNMELPLIESWCKMYQIEFKGEKPMIRINSEQRKAIRNFYEPKFEGKDFMILHTNGGLYQNEKPFCWQRDMPFDIACKVAKHFQQKGMFVMQITRPTSPKIPNVFVRNEQLSQTELCGLLELTSKRLLIDSCLQHASCALDLPATVLWHGTNPKLFGHTIHENIRAKEKPRKPLPGAFLFDVSFDGNESEWTYEEGDEKDLFNVDEIIASLEKQSNTVSKGFG
jgi:hypothetical protein